MTRMWLTSTTGRRGGATGVEFLTDEQALERLLRGEKITPVEGTKKLVETIREEMAVA